MHMEEIDRLLYRGDRSAIEALLLSILRNPTTADQVERLYEARIPKARGDAEFCARNAYEAAHWLALLSRELPPYPQLGEQ